jgi:hypothetical protein
VVKASWYATGISFAPDDFFPSMEKWLSLFDLAISVEVKPDCS